MLPKRLLKKTIQKKFDKVSGTLDIIPGWIGASESEIETSTPGIIYVRLSNGVVVYAINVIAPNIFDYPVLLARSKSNPKLWEVIGIRQAYGSPVADELKYHHRQHEFPGPDTVFVGGNQFMPFLLSALSGLTAKLYGGAVTLADGTKKFISTQTIDFTSNIPSSGAIYVLVEARDDGTIDLVAGSGVGSKELLTASDIPAADDGALDLWAVQLYVGQIEISYIDFIDLRFGRAGGGGGSLSQIQTDWFQNDSGEVDYIKNRPLQFKKPCTYVYTSALPNSPTYDNGSSGVGATLTAGSNGSLGTLVTGQRILIAGQSTSAQNGIYDVTNTGDGSNPYVLTRANDMDEPVEFPLAVVPVIGNNSTIYLLSLISNPTIGTTSLTFVSIIAALVSSLGSFAYISSLAHSSTTGITTDDHHAKSHTHNGDGSGTVPYSAVSGKPTLNFSINQGRLTFASGSPVTMSDQVDKTQVIFENFRGDKIDLYNGSTWDLYTHGAPTLTPASLVPYVIRDVFIYLSSGIPTLEELSWNAGPTGSITGVTNANPFVVTSNSHGLTVDDIISILNVAGATGANGQWRISARTTNTFTCIKLDGSNPGAPGVYTSGGSWYQSNYLGTRATDLAWSSGRLVKSGDPTRKYLGSLRANYSAKLEDSIAKRLLWNYHNRVLRTTWTNDTTTHDYNTTTERAWNNNFNNRAEFLIGVLEEFPMAGVLADFRTSGSSGSAVVRMILSAFIAGTVVPTSGAIVNNSNSYIKASNFAEIDSITAPGYYFVGMTESGAGATTTFRNGRVSVDLMG